MKFRKIYTIRNWMSVVFSIKVNYEIGSSIHEISNFFFFSCTFIEICLDNGAMFQMVHAPLF